MHTNSHLTAIVAVQTCLGPRCIDVNILRVKKTETLTIVIIVTGLEYIYLFFLFSWIDGAQLFFYESTHNKV